jgi:hypothetical protein
MMSKRPIGKREVSHHAEAVVGGSNLSLTKRNFGNIVQKDIILGVRNT